MIDPSAVCVGANGGPPPIQTTPVAHAHHQGYTGIVTTTIDALKSSPTLLAIVLINSMMIAAPAYFLAKQEDNRHVERLELFKILSEAIQARQRY